VGARDRSIRFVFDTVVDSYASGRPEMPVGAVREAARAIGVPVGARVLEVGAGTGQLTHALIEPGFEVVVLEPRPARYLDLIGSMGHVAASGKRDTLLAELRPILGDRPFELVDLVWMNAARAA
jgi:hypothetical protein